MIKNIKEIFKEYDTNENFGTIAYIKAFERLNEILPNYIDILATSRNGKTYLEIPIEELAKLVTEEDIHYLIQCGVIYDSVSDHLILW